MSRSVLTRLLVALMLVFPTALESSAAAAPQTCGPGEAVIGWFGDGVTCLGANGWATYDKTNTSIRIGQVDDIAICPDGTTWIADSGGLISVRDGTWTNHSTAFSGLAPDALACAREGGVWYGGFNKLGRFDGTQLQPIDVTVLGPAKYAGTIKDLAVGPNGELWVVSSTSLARFSQGAWTYWMNGRGYSTKYDYYFEAIALDRAGKPYAAASSALLRFTNGKWTNMLPTSLTQPKSIVVDARGRLWLGTYAKGLGMWDGKRWTVTSWKANGLASSNVTALAVDTANRLWVGTDWGISVLSGSKWATYRMENASIPANDVHAIAVAGRGPTLPAKERKALGTFTGRLVLNGTPQAGLTVEACSEFIGGLFHGKTPCSDQVFHRTTTTGTDGRFTFTLANGKYGLTYKARSGTWVRLTDGYRIGSREMLVPAGGSLDIGDIEMSKAT